MSKLSALCSLCALALVCSPVPSLAQDDDDVFDTDEDWDDEDDAADTGGAETSPAASAAKPEPGLQRGADLEDEDFDEADPDDHGDETSGMGEEQEQQVAQEIATLTDIYLTHRQRRDPLEQIVVDGGRAEIWFLHGLEGGAAEVQAARCDAFRWLLFGRLTRSRGVFEVFRRFPSIQEVRLNLFTIGTTIEPDGRRGYRQVRKANAKMEITITRDTAASLDPVQQRKRLRGPACVTAGEGIVDKTWYTQQEGSH